MAVFKVRCLSKFAILFIYIYFFFGSSETDGNTVLMNLWFVIFVGLCYSSSNLHTSKPAILLPLMIVGK